jgi:hypothetical protein
MINTAQTPILIVHCRTGSLEIASFAFAWKFEVHCRTGSLEMDILTLAMNQREFTAT